MYNYLSLSLSQTHTHTRPRRLIFEAYIYYWWFLPCTRILRMSPLGFVSARQCLSLSCYLQHHMHVQCSCCGFRVGNSYVGLMLSTLSTSWDQWHKAEHCSEIQLLLNWVMIVIIDKIDWGEVFHHLDTGFKAQERLLGGYNTYTCMEHFN